MSSNVKEIEYADRYEYSCQREDSPIFRKY